MDAGATGLPADGADLDLAGRGTGFPQDKITCQGRFLRYVVACMHNCRERHHCAEFWEFFRVRGITPAQYAGRDAIGEVVMKRVVFDCDRCGKKDVGEPVSAWRTSGPDEGQKLDPAAFHEVATRGGKEKVPCPEPFLLGLLELLRDQKGWEHYCVACFRKVAGLAGGIVGKPAAPRPAASESAMTPAARALTGGGSPRPTEPARARPAAQVKPLDELVPPPAPHKASGRKAAGA